MDTTLWIDLKNPNTPPELMHPANLEQVLITWVNTDPEPYYEHIKGKSFTAPAIWHKGNWYWWSSTTEDMLAEYGEYEAEKIDPAIDILAWIPFPLPYGEEV